MMRFGVEFAIFFAVTALSTLPVTWVARLVKRRHRRRKWLGSAAFTALVVAGLGWGSRDLQSSCKSERNSGCIDIGGAGAQFMVMSTFVIFSLASAYLMYND